MSQTACILVVNDDPVTLRSQRHLLSAVGYTVIQALDGSEALDLVRAHRPDLVLLDVVMPDPDGIEVCRRIKADPDLDGVFILLYSAIRTVSDEQSEALETGADGYITLPIPNRELLARVEAMLRLKRAEDALRGSDRRYRNLFENAVEGIFQTTPEGRILLANPALAKMYGYQSTEEMVASIRSIEEELYVDAHDRRQFMQLLASREEVKDFECRHRKNDGTAFWVSMSGRPVYGENGEVLYYEGRVVDIDERKQAEEVLKRYELLSKNARDIILFLSQDGGILEANEAALKAYGYDRHTMLTLRIHDLRAAGVRHLTDDLIAQAFADGFQIETEHTRKDGSVFPVEVSSRGVEIGREKMLLSIIRDLTERKNAEEQLRDSERRFRMLTENLPLGVSLMRENQTYEYFNPTFTEIFGYTLEDLPDRKALIESFYPSAAYRERVMAEWRQEDSSSSGIERVKETTVTARTKDGKDKAIHIRSVVLGDGRRLVSYQDVTGQRKLEDQLRQAQKMEAIGTLAGGIAHDFNNILGIITGYAEIIGFSIPADSKARDSVKELLSAACRARDLVAQILAFSRMSEQQRKPMQLIPAVKQAFRLLRPSLPSTIEILQKIDVPDGDDLVLADATQIQQLLMNLSTNAAHAMREQGGILEVSLSPVLFEPWDGDKPAELDSGNYLRLSIRDTGTGMDRATMERIFDPYFTTKGPGEGTGLGLAVVHGIVKNHKGAVNVWSEPGKGTVFNVFLPGLKRQAIQEEEDRAWIPRGNETLLLVDDEEKLLESIRELLEYLGYEVVTSSSSLDALELFRTMPDRFDLVITDYTMPKMTGIDLAAEMLRIRPDISVILCTGFSNGLVETKLGESGIRECLLKPLSAKTLAGTIRRVLDESSS